MHGNSLKLVRLLLCVSALALLLAMQTTRAAQSPVVQQALLKASDMGRATAISGNTALIGAADGPGNSGAAYIFVRDGTNWTQQAYLKASNTETQDGFAGGYGTVAIDGDTAIVGAVSEDSNANGVDGDESNNSAENSGAAYVFVRSGTTWTQQAYLKASNTGVRDFFGSTVAISGDTAVVGAILEDSSATGVNGDESNDDAYDSGAAYVFVRNGTNWSQQAYLKASNTRADAQFGNVAISGDTLVVGAGEWRIGAGAAYVFVREGTTWSEQAVLAASNADSGGAVSVAVPGDWFGTSVAISGDTVIVGAAFEDSSATGVNGVQTNNSTPDSGAAYVFVRNGTTWSQQAYLKASNTGRDDQFGGAVAISGDTAVIGAWWEASNARGINGNQANNSLKYDGAAYVFVRNGTNWSQQAYLKAFSNPGQAVGFGTAAIDGDTVLVGAAGAGAAYVFAGVAPVRLAISPFAAGGMRLSWPPFASDYVLEQTSALESPPTATIWSEIPAPYESDATANFITVPSPAGNAFYRLRKP